MKIKVGMKVYDTILKRKGFVSDVHSADRIVEDLTSWAGDYYTVEWEKTSDSGKSYRRNFTTIPSWLERK